MIISDDRMERVAFFGWQAMQAHRPASGTLPRLSGDEFPQPENLARTAAARVDSYFGTVNTADRSELYPIVNQVAIDWLPGAEGVVQVALGTVSPGFQAFETRQDGGRWQAGLETRRAWALHDGENWLEVRTINRAGHRGRASKLHVVYRPDGGPWPENLQVESHSGTACPGVIPFGWEDFRHPRLVALREKYRLDQVVEGAETDLERVVLLRDWIKSRWDHEQPLRLPPWDSLYILDQVACGIEAFFCVHYSVVMMQACLSLGIPARLINLHRGICRAEMNRGSLREMLPDPPCDEHVVNEVWLDDLGRWAMMDVDFDLHYERDGVPLSALEIHRALLDGQLGELHVQEGPLAYKLKSEPTTYQFHLPTYYRHFCVFWRNDHLSDPAGPTQVLHWVDEDTPPMLWWEGSDLRHRPQIIGPVAVSWPYSQETTLLTDGNVATCWASAETPQPHWVELQWPAPVLFDHVVLDWAHCWDRYWTSANYRLEIWRDGGWHELTRVESNPQAARNCHRFAAVQTDRLRVWQPAGGGPPGRPQLLWLAEIEASLNENVGS